MLNIFSLLFFSFRVICGNWRKGWKLLFSHSISESTLLLKLLEKNPILFPFFLTDCFGAPIFALLFPRMCFCVDKFLETEFMLVMFCELWYDTREIILTAATSTKHTLITMALVWWASHSQPIVLRTYTFVWHSSHFLKSGSELESDELNIVLFSQQFHQLSKMRSRLRWWIAFAEPKRHRVYWVGRSPSYHSNFKLHDGVCHIGGFDCYVNN